MPAATVTCRGVPSLDQAQAVRYGLWKGLRKTKLDRILSALDAVQIPLHFHRDRELPTSNIRYWNSHRSPTFDFRV